MQIVMERNAFQDPFPLLYYETIVALLFFCGILAEKRGTSCPTLRKWQNVFHVVFCAIDELRLVLEELESRTQVVRLSALVVSREAVFDLPVVVGPWKGRLPISV